jgi:probable F420-dependent oxidoreductase
MAAVMFGLGISTSAAAGANPVADGRRAEELGFDFVSASDHLHGADPTYEPWTMLTWIAAATSRIRVATRVLGVPYRNPAVVAKMAESLDRLSDGRLILGMGGGYSDDEFRAFGLGVRPPRDKVDGLEEAVTIARGLWSQERFTFHGRLYGTEDAMLAPSPAHRIPIWLGTYGDRALAVTGRLADGWIPSFGFAPPERAVVMRDKVLAAARDAGREPEEITCVYNIDVHVGERVDPQPGVVSGSPDAVAEQLLGFVKIGFAAMNFLLSGTPRDEQAERLAREVIPLVRAAV